MRSKNPQRGRIILGEYNSLQRFWPSWWLMNFSPRILLFVHKINSCSKKGFENYLSDRSIGGSLRNAPIESQGKMRRSKLPESPLHRWSFPGHSIPCHSNFFVICSSRFLFYDVRFDRDHDIVWLVMQLMNFSAMAVQRCAIPVDAYLTSCLEVYHKIIDNCLVNRIHDTCSVCRVNF
jgi:hypothetical protein